LGVPHQLIDIKEGFTYDVQEAERAFMNRVVTLVFLVTLALMTLACATEEGVDAGGFILTTASGSGWKLLCLCNPYVIQLFIES